MKETPIVVCEEAMAETLRIESAMAAHTRMLLRKESATISEASRFRKSLQSILEEMGVVWMKIAWMDQAHRVRSSIDLSYKMVHLVMGNPALQETCQRSAYCVP